MFGSKFAYFSFQVEGEQKGNRKYTGFPLGIEGYFKDLYALRKKTLLFTSPQEFLNFNKQKQQLAFSLGVTSFNTIRTDSIFAQEMIGPLIDE